MMSFRYFAYPPSSALLPFIDVIWGVSGAHAHHSEVVLPNGVVELMVNFGPVQKVIGYGDRTVDESFRRFWIAGIQDRPLVIASPLGANHMGVRFRPGGAHAFFGLPMDELLGRVVDLDLIVGTSASEELRERLEATDGDQARCRVAEQWLLERRYAVHPYLATTRRALDLLNRSPYNLTVAELCDRLGLSNRHLIDQFREVVGLPPKVLFRIRRFHAVVNALKGHYEADWPQVAFRFGFSDQPHLIREFRHFAGVTPNRFLGLRSVDHAHVVVGGTE
jgi:AraC-like DNA-binding protein